MIPRPEDIAREQIDKMLFQAGWDVQKHRNILGSETSWKHLGVRSILLDYYLDN